MNKEEMITDLRAKIIIGKKIFSTCNPENVKRGGESYCMPCTNAQLDLILELLDEDERDAQLVKAYKDGYLEGVRETIQRYTQTLKEAKDDE